MQEILDQVESMHAATATGEELHPESFLDLKARLIESQGFVRQAENHMNDRSELSELQDNKCVELEERLASVEKEYEELLGRNLGPADVEEVKDKLAKVYSDRRDVQANLMTTSETS